MQMERVCMVCGGCSAVNRLVKTQLGEKRSLNPRVEEMRVLCGLMVGQEPGRARTSLRPEEWEGVLWA